VFFSPLSRSSFRGHPGPPQLLLSKRASLSPRLAMSSLSEFDVVLRLLLVAQAFGWQAGIPGLVRAAPLTSRGLAMSICGFAARGFLIVEEVGDGNCFFRMVARYLGYFEGEEPDHARVRSMLCDRLLSLYNDGKLGAYVIDPLDFIRGQLRVSQLDESAPASRRFRGDCWVEYINLLRSCNPQDLLYPSFSDMRYVSEMFALDLYDISDLYNGTTIVTIESSNGGARIVPYRNTPHHFDSLQPLPDAAPFYGEIPSDLIVTAISAFFAIRDKCSSFKEAVDLCTEANTAGSVSAALHARLIAEVARQSAAAAAAQAAAGEKRRADIERSRVKKLQAATSAALARAAEDDALSAAVALADKERELASAAESRRTASSIVADFDFWMQNGIQAVTLRPLDSYLVTLRAGRSLSLTVFRKLSESLAALHFFRAIAAGSLPRSGSACSATCQNASIGACRNAKCFAHCHCKQCNNAVSSFASANLGTGVFLRGVLPIAAASQLFLPMAPRPVQAAAEARIPLASPPPLVAQDEGNKGREEPHPPMGDSLQVPEAAVLISKQLDLVSAYVALLEAGNFPHFVEFDSKTFLIFPQGLVNDRGTEGAPVLSLARDSPQVIVHCNTSLFCSACDSYNAIESRLTATDCVHKRACGVFLPRAKELPVFGGSFAVFSPPPDPARRGGRRRGRGGARHVRRSGAGGDNDSDLPPIHLVLAMGQTMQHNYAAVIPVRDSRSMFVGMPAIVKMPKNFKGSFNVQCQTCASGFRHCIHTHTARRTALELYSPTSAQRGREEYKPPQSTAMHTYLSEYLPTDCEKLPAQLTPGNGGGTFSACPICKSGFGDVAVLQCPMYLIQFCGGIKVTVRDMFSFSCLTPACSGRQYYDGNLHGISVLSARPSTAGRPQDRAWAMDYNTLCFFVRDIAERSVASTYLQYFSSQPFPSRGDFSSAMQRARMYLFSIPPQEPFDCDVVVQDGCLHLGPTHNFTFSGRSSVGASHTCDTTPPGPFANPLLPLHGMFGDELPFLPTGLPQLADNLALQTLRDFFCRLGASAVRANGAPLGWGTFAVGDIDPVVTQGELLGIVQRFGSWSHAVLATAPPATPERTCTARALADAILAVLPLLCSLAGETGETEGGIITPPSYLANLLFSLQAKAVCSATARCPFFGAVFFAALGSHLQSGGGLHDHVPDHVLDPQPGIISSFRCIFFRGAMDDTKAVSYATALHFLAPELYLAFIGSSSDSLRTTPLLALLPRYIYLATTVSSRRLRVLVNEPVIDAFLYAPFGKKLVSAYDTLWTFSVTVDDALKHASFAEEAAAIVRALQFTPRDLDSPQGQQRGARCGLLLSGAPFVRQAALHYYNTHGPNESGSCSSCRKACDSKHCKLAASEDDEDGVGCSHNFGGKAGFTGGALTLMSGATGKVVGINLIESKESMFHFFSIYNNYSTVKEPSHSTLGIPSTHVYDSACQQCSYFLRRNPQRFQLCRFVVDHFHSSDHKVMACQLHLHAKVYFGPREQQQQHLQPWLAGTKTSGCEAFHSWITPRASFITASPATAYASLAQQSGIYNNTLSGSAAPVKKGFPISPLLFRHPAPPTGKPILFGAESFSIRHWQAPTLSSNELGECDAEAAEPAAASSRKRAKLPAISEVTMGAAQALCVPAAFIDSATASVSDIETFPSAASFPATLNNLAAYCRGSVAVLSPSLASTLALRGARAETRYSARLEHLCETFASIAGRPLFLFYPASNFSLAIVGSGGVFSCYVILSAPASAAIEPHIASLTSTFASQLIVNGFAKGGLTYRRIVVGDGEGAPLCCALAILLALSCSRPYILPPTAELRRDELLWIRYFTYSCGGSGGISPIFPPQSFSQLATWGLSPPSSSSMLLEEKATARKTDKVDTAAFDFGGSSAGAASEAAFTVTGSSSSDFSTSFLSIDANSCGQWSTVLEAAAKTERGNTRKCVVSLDGLPRNYPWTTFAELKKLLDPCLPCEASSIADYFSLLAARFPDVVLLNTNQPLTLAEAARDLCNPHTTRAIVKAHFINGNHFVITLALPSPTGFIVSYLDSFKKCDLGHHDNEHTLAIEALKQVWQRQRKTSSPAQILQRLPPLDIARQGSTQHCARFVCLYAECVARSLPFPSAASISCSTDPRCGIMRFTRRVALAITFGRLDVERL
jgi:hypothetical protein